MKKRKRAHQLTRKDIKRLKSSLTVLRSDKAGEYDSISVDCCQHLLNVLNAREAQ